MKSVIDVTFNNEIFNVMKDANLAEEALHMLCVNFSGNEILDITINFKLFENADTRFEFYVKDELRYTYISCLPCGKADLNTALTVMGLIADRCKQSTDWAQHLATTEVRDLLDEHALWFLKRQASRYDNQPVTVIKKEEISKYVIN